MSTNSMMLMGAGPSGVSVSPLFSRLDAVSITDITSARLASKIWKDTSKTLQATADGDAVRCVTDNQGNDWLYSAGTNPTLRLVSGRWCVRFTGGSLACTTLAVNNNDHTAYWLMSNTNVGGILGIYSVSNAINLYSASGTSGVNTLGDTLFAARQQDQVVPWSIAFRATECHIRGGIFNTDGGELSGAQSAGTATSLIFGGTAGASNPMTGDIYGWQICSAGHTNAVSDGVCNAAYAEFRATSIVVIAAKHVYCVGDSRTYGYPLATFPPRFPQLMQTNLLGTNAITVDVVNGGVGGNTAANLVARGADVDTQRRSGSVLVVWIGTNDNWTTIATTYAYCDARRAAGWKVVLCTDLFRSSGGSSVNRTAYNTDIRLNWALHADALADLAADLTIGTDLAASDVTLFSDGLHLTALAQTYVEAIVRAAVLPLL